MSSVRRATHAGSWYPGSASKLNHDLDRYLDAVPSSKPGSYDSLPVPGARFIVGPHAGYTYAGPTLAESYKALDVTNIKRVFILGPSHHVFFRGARLTKFAHYETPIGTVPVDVDTTAELSDTGLFDKMSAQTDEDEHSFEMHMPFLYKVASAQGTVPKLVPILVGSCSAEYERQMASVLAPYFQDKSNAFVISTDFCHWGDRFDYLVYTTKEDCSDARSLSYSAKADPKVPIYKSIEYLDRLGMQKASTGSYDEFNQYLDKTDNTICGRRPLAILLKTVELANSDARLNWIGYAQSSKVHDVLSSSVSYASGFAVA